MEQIVTRGRFLRRYKRFFADVEIPEHGVVTAHCPNTGSMKTLLTEGTEAWCRFTDDPKRKLAWSLVLLGVPGGYAMIDTALPNRIVAEGIQAGLVPSLSGYESIRKEVKVGNSRLDLLLENSSGNSEESCYVEVKNVTMSSLNVSEDGKETAGVRGRADFPDAVTSRGRKHLEELTALAEGNCRAAQVFFMGRTDTVRVGIAADIDADYYETLKSAVSGGVEVIALKSQIDLAEQDLEVMGCRSPFQRVTIDVAGECPVELD